MLAAAGQHDRNGASQDQQIGEQAPVVDVVEVELGVGGVVVVVVAATTLGTDATAWPFARRRCSRRARSIIIIIRSIFVVVLLLLLQRFGQPSFQVGNIRSLLVARGLEFFELLLLLLLRSDGSVVLLRLKAACLCGVLQRMVVVRVAQR